MKIFFIASLIGAWAFSSSANATVITNKISNTAITSINAAAGSVIFNGDVSCEVQERVYGLTKTLEATNKLGQSIVVKANKQGAIDIESVIDDYKHAKPPATKTIKLVLVCSAQNIANTVLMRVAVNSRPAEMVLAKTTGVLVPSASLAVANQNGIGLSMNQYYNDWTLDIVAQ